MKHGAMYASLASICVCLSVLGTDKIGVKRYTNNEKKILKEALEGQDRADSANDRAQQAEKKAKENAAIISNLTARIRTLEEKNKWLEKLVVRYITNGNYQILVPEPEPPVDEEALAREQEFKHALTTAETLLKAIDRKRYADVYNEAGQSFQNAYTRERWIGMVSGKRTGYGDLVTRTRVADSEAEALSDTADQLLATCTYTSEFRNAKVIETLTLEKAKGGEWQLRDYTLK